MDKPFNNCLKIVDCPVCGGENHRPYLELRYGDLKQKRNLDYSVLGINEETKLFVRRCYECGLVFVNPRLKSECETLVYNECKKRMYEKENKEDDFTKKVKNRKEKVEYLSPLLQVLSFVDLQASNITLFDFGCGFGYCMGFAREFGIDAYGVDIDRQRLAICKKKGLKVAHPDEFDDKYPEIKADVILWMSNIEHLIDLSSAASFIKDKCKPGTVLYVNGLTPRIIAIEQRRGEFVKAHFIEHINYFPIKTLDHFMSAYGFRPLVKPYMTVIRSFKDLLKASVAFMTGQTLGYNPLNGVFVRLYRYSI